MYQQIQTDVKTPRQPTHAERIQDLTTRVLQLETLVAQLDQGMRDEVGYHIPGIPPQPTNAINSIS